MSHMNSNKHIPTKYSELRSNKLDKFISSCQDEFIRLPERQFNCPSCIKSEKFFCNNLSWMKSSCDEMKCFNCPPKYQCLNAKDCHFIRTDEEIRKAN